VLPEPAGDHRARGLQVVSCGADVHVAGAIVAELGPGHQALGLHPAVEHRHVRLDAPAHEPADQPS
jgi:hypothetical protein